jgi:hypothetical protein
VLAEHLERSALGKEERDYDVTLYVKIWSRGLGVNPFHLRLPLRARVPPTFHEQRRYSRLCDAMVSSAGSWLTMKQCYYRWSEN